jgi:hypothetical protein
MMAINLTHIFMTNENRTMAYVSPKILETFMAPEGVLCASSPEITNFSREGEEWAW